MRVPREYVLPRGWQAYAIVTLIPLWWLIGVSFVMWGLIALPLLGALAVRGRVRAPRRFGIWLLFILWVIASGVELSDSGAGARLGVAALVLRRRRGGLPLSRERARAARLDAVDRERHGGAVGDGRDRRLARGRLPGPQLRKPDGEAPPARPRCRTSTCTRTSTWSSPRSSTSSASRSAGPRRSSPTRTPGGRPSRS